MQNWRAYEQSLIQRGSLTVWFSPQALAGCGYCGTRQRGGQYVYSDLAIETALSLRLVFHLGFRQTEGFVASLLTLLGLPLKAPDHTTLSRRQARLPVALPTLPPGQSMHLVVDSSGLKVYGEGE